MINVKTFVHKLRYRNYYRILEMQVNGTAPDPLAELYAKVEEYKQNQKKI